MVSRYSYVRYRWSHLSFRTRYSLLFLSFTTLGFSGCSAVTNVKLSSTAVVSLSWEKSILFTRLPKENSDNGTLHRKKKIKKPSL